MNLFDLLVADDRQLALVAPGQPALTYQQVRETLTTLVSQLHQFGLGLNDRIAIAMPNGIPMMVTFLAATLCGTAAPLNPKYKQDEFAFYFEDTQAKALITLPGTIDAAIAAITPDMLHIQANVNSDGTLGFELLHGNPQPLQSPRVPGEDDTAMILHTSGTTSRPKRVPIRHRNLIASAHNMIGAYRLTAEDSTLCLMPLFHIHGLVGCLLSTLGSGGKVVCPSGFNALEFWKWVEEFSPTWYSAAPTMHQTILARATRNASIVNAHPFRFIRSSSASLPPVVIEQTRRF
jgi:acyl-CoA synthetase (AMP-forming)/AMP-acid ligase II